MAPSTTLLLYYMLLADVCLLHSADNSAFTWLINMEMKAIVM